MAARHLRTSRNLKRWLTRVRAPTRGSARHARPRREASRWTCRIRRCEPCVRPAREVKEAPTPPRPPDLWLSRATGRLAGVSIVPRKPDWRGFAP